MRDTKKDKKIFNAVKDYYGPSGIPSIGIAKIALHITGRKMITLNDELKSDLFSIRQNMKDVLYMKSILNERIL